MSKPTKQDYMSEDNPYKNAWHALVIQIIGGYDPSDVVGMQNDPILRKMSIIEREFIMEDDNNHEPEDNDQPE